MKNAFNINSAIKHIKKGEVLAYPTEGVWGIGCDPFNEEAVKKILFLKDREVDKGLVLVAASLDQIDTLIEGLPKNFSDILKDSCPGPDTWLIPDINQVIPSWIKGNFATVAVRVSQHPIVKTLCENVGLLVSTSANPSGSEPALSQKQVEDYFVGENILILSGELGGQNKPSKIIDLMTHKVLRN